MFTLFFGESEEQFDPRTKQKRRITLELVKLLNYFGKRDARCFKLVNKPVGP